MNRIILTIILVSTIVGGVMAENPYYMGDAYPGGINDPAKRKLVFADPAVVELVEASRGVLPYLKAPGDREYGVHVTTLEHRLPPTEIELAEQEIKRLKGKDAAIRRLRKALDSFM